MVKEMKEKLKSRVNGILNTKVSPIQLYSFCVICIMVGVVISCSSILERNADMQFLYNRAYQMYDCIRNGKIPFYYYNDNIGTGYGSSFFYGQLTLYPFLIFIPLGFKFFIRIYGISVVILTYFGARAISKRLAKNYELSAILYTASACSLYIIDFINLYSNAMGIAISLFFLASCVDFLGTQKVVCQPQ
jgi:hypothetical protein